MDAQFAINAIRIGERARKDMGDLQSLADSMRQHGLLHPVVVMKDGLLVAGHRRIEAARLLGWKDIPVTVVDVADLLSAERDENTERKDFTPTEAVEIGRMIEEQHKAKIEKQKHDVAVYAGRVGQGASSVANHDRAGKTDVVVGRAVGMGQQKYARAKAVVAAAEAEPETFGDLPERMDETGNVTGTHKEMERRKSGNGRNPALHGMSHLKPNRELQRAVWSLEGVCVVLAKLPYGELDPSKTKEWAASLKKSVTVISRTARRLANVKAR